MLDFDITKLHTTSQTWIPCLSITMVSHIPAGIPRVSQQYDIGIDQMGKSKNAPSETLCVHHLSIAHRHSHLCSSRQMIAAFHERSAHWLLWVPKFFLRSCRQIARKPSLGLEIEGFRQDEYLQADWRFDALDEHNRLALEDSHHQVMRWNLIEDAGALCPRVCDTLPGFIRHVHISLQHCYEADISGHVFLHCVVHEIPENSPRLLRQEQRHISTLLPDPALFCSRSLDQSQVHIFGGSVDFLLVSGGGRYNTSIGAVAKVEERRQPYRKLCLLPWGIPWILSPQLGLSILHG